MKSYNVKFNIGQEVYILNNKSIYRSKIDKIRITEYKPCELINSNEHQTQDAKEGVSIEYLVVISHETIGNSYKIGFDWKNQRDIFSTSDELIAILR